MARKPPDPLDPSDPRVAQEWKDKYGQVVHPGDLVTYMWGETYGQLRQGAKHQPVEKGRATVVA